MATATSAKLATACEHTDRPAKARGLCKPCWSKEQRSGWASASTALAIADLGPGTTVRFGRQTKLVHEIAGTVAGLAKLYDGAVVDVADVRLYAAPGPVSCPECIDQKAAGKAARKAAKAPNTPTGVTLHDVSGQQYPDDPDQTAGPATLAPGQVECPECGKVVSKSNKARHLKGHAA